MGLPGTSWYQMEKCKEMLYQKKKVLQNFKIASQIRNRDPKTLMWRIVLSQRIFRLSSHSEDLNVCSAMGPRTYIRTALQWLKSWLQIYYIYNILLFKIYIKKISIVKLKKCNTAYTNPWIALLMLLIQMLELHC